MTSSPPISCHYFLSTLLFWENKLKEEKKAERTKLRKQKQKKKLLVSHSTSFSYLVLKSKPETPEMFHCVGRKKARNI